MKRSHLIHSVAVALIAIVGSHATAAEKTTEKITYEEHIQPIFRSRCFSCHRTDKKTADLDLSNFTAMMTGGASGTSIEPGSADDSYLFNLVNHDSEPFMPPKSDKLPARELDLIRRWIEGGAPENKASKVTIKKKTFDFGLKGAPTGKPEGPPPMPDVLSIEAIVTTRLKTAVSAVATSPWAPLAAVAGQKQIVLYHTGTLEQVGVLPYPEGVPQVLKFSRNGSLLLAGGGRGASKGLVVVWNVKTGERVFEIGDELDSVLAADISSDQTLIALGGPGRVVRVYTTYDGELAYELTKHTEWIYSLEFSPDSVLLATADRNGGMFVWEAQTGREYLTLNGHSAAITDLSWRIDSNVLASTSEDTTIKLWEMENGRQIKNWGAHGGGSASVEFCRDGRLVSCGRDKVAKIWQQDGKQIRAFEAFGDLALRVTHCDETNRVIAGDWSGLIRVWKADDGARVGELNQNPPKLDARLAAAKQALTARQTEQQQKTAAYNAAKAKLDKTNTDLAAARKQFADAQKLNQTATAGVKTAKAAIAKLDGEIATAAKREDQLKKAVPQLQQAAVKAQEASSMMAEDKDLATIAGKLKQQFDQKNAELAATTKTLGEKRKLHTDTKTQLATFEKQVKDSAATMATSKKQVDTLAAAIKPAQDATNQAKAALDASNQAVALAGKSVNVLTEYVALHGELQALAAKRSEFETQQLTVAEAEAELQQSQTNVNTANQAVTTSQNNVNAAVAAVNAVKQNAAKLTTERDAAAKAAAALEPVVPLLTAALGKANEAAAKASGDKEIAAAVAQFKTLLDKRTATLNAHKKTVTDRNTAIEKSKQDLVVAEKKVVGANMALAAAKKKAEEMVAAMKPVEQKVAAAKQNAVVAEQAVQAAAQVVEARRVKLRPALNIQQAQANAG